ncbi:dTMP kinase [Coxiella endosymbiont of Amblyomma nuttalli]|uniref:dTMP kinase n=1 Tax=Coxiella endosymbiont of Amblyomma nuttalli TaxID=2749996 RepID=UPI001BAAEA74|nr:dTMP kinase [Coxiella endosymbiont of Amblyomma nuttalli]QTS84100.1 Thymidylate kinase [Coxiella endosymbiont of Amblyomma nuttalli]
MERTEGGRFISFEGIEGVGKTTALNYVREQLDLMNIPYIITREPGGTLIAEAIRRILLDHYTEMMCPDTELLLIFAGRAQNIAQVVLPALRRGKWVLSDRFTDASFAYQGGGRGIPVNHIKKLAKWVHGDLKPDITLLLDAPVSVGLNRVNNRGAKDRIETEGLEFFKRVRKSYLKMARQEPQWFRVIHADQKISLVKEQILKAIKPLLTL